MSKWWRSKREPICFGLCLEKYVSHRFWHSFRTVKRLPEDIEYSVSMARTDRARNQIVRHFLKEKRCTHVMFLDSDQVFPPDVVGRLQHWHVPVVGGLYFQRDVEYPIPHMYRWSETEKTETGEAGMDPILGWKDGLLKVDVVGTGCMLVERSVFERIPSPWFEYGGESESEDVTFCRKLGKAGIPVYCDTTCESGHLGEAIIGRTQFKFWLAAKNKTIDLAFLKEEA